MPAMQLVRPSAECLPGYIEALARGWSSDSERGAAAAADEMARIREDPAAFLRWMDDPEGAGPAVTLPDGSLVPRLPGLRRWMWDGEFAGSIGLRWQAGTMELPEYCLGHIGYAVVPWKQRRGYATAALQAMLGEARRVGLPFVHITTDIGNAASQRVILRAGGVLQERFNKPAQFRSKEALRYRVDVPAVAAPE